MNAIKTRASARARVASGAELLDDLMPGWHDRIDLNSMHVSSPSRCVLGQLYPGGLPDPYCAGIAALGINDEDDEDVDLGFQTAGEAWEYGVLTVEWRAQTEMRRAAS